MPANTPNLITRRLAWVIVTIILVVLAAMIPGQIASAEKTTSGSKNSSSKPKPTIVLVHGAFNDASNWRLVTEQLQSEGYQVLAAPNALRGPSSDAAYLAAFMQQRTSGPIVLVGHSYGGMVITNAATQDTDVKALVYINALAPDKGESAEDLFRELPGSKLVGDPTTLYDYVSYPGAPEGVVDVYLKPAAYAQALANDLPPETVEVLAASQLPYSSSAPAEPSGPPAWKTIPSWYLVGTIDNAIPPAQQRAMAQRAGSKLVEVESGHMSMLSHPDAVTDLIKKAASSVRYDSTTAAAATTTPSATAASTATATASASPTASPTASPSASASAAVQKLPDSGGGSTRVALLAALALIGCGLGAIALVRRRFT